MLKWCSYCQQFIGELPDYDDLTISHGICASCKKRLIPRSTAPVIDHAIMLRGIFRRLYEAGRRDDFATAEQAIASAIIAGCRPVDILIGMIAPMLHRIGESWKRGTLSIDDEHQFSAFCERVIDLVTTNMRPASPKPDHVPILFLNAPGNRHSLAGRILDLWLQSRGFEVRAVDSDQEFEPLMEQLAAANAKYLLISMSLLDQLDGIQKIAKRILSWPRHLQPKIIVGGYAVKAGLLREVKGATLTADIHALDFV